jgi:galactokinase
VSIAEEVSAHFETAYGHEADGVWAAPGRVNLIGEHTDYNDGFVLPFALAERTYAAASRREDSILELRSAQSDDKVEAALADLAPERARGWAGYPAGVAWALRSAGLDVGGASVLVDGRVPLGSGLSSSAALECAVATALRDLWSLDISDAELALACQRAENDFVGAPTGIMDQMASMLCREGSALFLDVRTREVEHVPLDPAAQGTALLVVDTRVQHAHSDGGYGARRRDCEEAVREIGVPALRDVSVDDLDAALAKVGDEVRRRRVRHVVTENARVVATVAAMRAGDLAAVGRLMSESHVSMRDDYEISVPELDVAVATAQSHGALGARMTGGGFGGCAIALVPADQVGSIGAAVHEAFAVKGFTSPRSWPVTPSAGAHRLT